MKAVILAAGKGTRLYPITKDIPKPMVKLGEKPLLEHILGNLSRQGIKQAIINLHHQPESITSYFGDGRGLKMNIKYSYEPQILGTAGAVKNVEQELTERFLIIYGDNFCNFDYRGFIDFHEKKRALATMALAHGANPMSGGIAKVEDDDRITGFLEKPTADQVFSPWVNGGIYLFEPPVLDYIPKNRFYDFGHDFFPAFLKSGGKVYGYKMSETLRGVNTLEEYDQAQKFYYQGDQERQAV